MKNAGVGVGIPDTGRLPPDRWRTARLHIYCRRLLHRPGPGHGARHRWSASRRAFPGTRIVYERSNTYCAPDSGTTSGSRQTLFTGEAVPPGLPGSAGGAWGPPDSLDALNGQEFYGEYLGKTDPLGADGAQPRQPRGLRLRHPGVHPRRATGHIRKMVAAHDVGKAVNPLSMRGADRGRRGDEHGLCPDGAVSPHGLQAHRQIRHAGPVPGQPESRRSPPSSWKKPGLNVACGAIGIGEITSIPTAPAIADAYYRYDGKFRTSLPLEGTPYSRK